MMEGDRNEIESTDGGRVVRQFSPFARERADRDTLEESRVVRMLHQVEHNSLCKPHVVHMKQQSQEDRMTVRIIRFRRDTFTQICVAMGEIRK